MRPLLVFFAFIALGIVLSTLFVSPSFVMDFERSAVTSAFVVTEECRSAYMVYEEFSRAERDRMEENRSAESVAEENVFSDSFCWLLGGSYRRVFDSGFSPEFVRDLEEKIQTNCLHYDGVPDYKGFAFRDRMKALDAPLSDDELAYVFFEIVKSYTPDVPIKGNLEEISFVNEKGFLRTKGVITLSFAEIAEKYSICFLPPSATFVLTVPFSIKNSEICVCSEGIELTCESFPLPKALLIFGCNAAFGKKDYQSLFGEALENVFVNGGFFGESIARAR